MSRMGTCCRPSFNRGCSGAWSSLGRRDQDAMRTRSECMSGSRVLRKLLLKSNCMMVLSAT